MFTGYINTARELQKTTRISIRCRRRWRRKWRRRRARR